MGLFDFMKKKSETTTLKNPQEFYTACIEDFHREAQACGVAKKGLIFIPELIDLGETAVLAYLRDSYLQNQFGDNPTVFYDVIMSLAIDSGIAFANKWHEDFAHLKAYAIELISQGPADDANELLIEHFSASIAEDQGNPYFRKIFARWMAMHKPYWDLDDPRTYTFKALMAAYQLGISMMLDKLGY